MAEFDLHISRLYASLIGMQSKHAHELRTMAATMQALHQNTQRALREYANAR